MERKDYNIYAGLGGSFGGAVYQGTLKDVDEVEAGNYAYELACEEFEHYEGLHGLCDYDDFLEEYPDGTEEDYEDFRNDQIDTWADYEAIPTDEDEEVDKSEIQYLN